MSLLGAGLARADRLAEARAALDELRARERGAYVHPIAVATVAANVGEEEMALAYVEESMAWDRHAACAWWLCFPLWDRLHREPRFTAALERVGMVAP